MCKFCFKPAKDGQIIAEFISTPDPRGVCISTLFTRGIIYHVNSVVGDLIPKENMLNLNNFDGQLFQWLYLKAKPTKSVERLRQYLSEENFKEVEKYYDFVTNGGNKIKK